MLKETSIPIEYLIYLQNKLDELPPRDQQRKELVHQAAQAYGVSVSTVRRELRNWNSPNTPNRKDHNKPRVITQRDMELFCKIIAALKVKSTNKKHRCLSTETCIAILEDHGVLKVDQIITAPKGILKRSTVDKYIKRWQYDRNSVFVTRPAVRFQATHSNECWQFDFSPSDLKYLDLGKQEDSNKTLMLASVIDDRSGVSYQEYHLCYGEDVMTALRFLFNAMASKSDKNNLFEGIPGVLYIDNGPVSRSKIFNRVMNMLGVEIRQHMPKGSDGRRTTARSKGKVERDFRSTKDGLETLFHFHQPESLIEANEWLQHYLKKHNARQHRIESHSKLDDWLKNIPESGLKSMCSWERFSAMAREPLKRKADISARISLEGTLYQLDSHMAGEEVTVLLGLFDNEVYIEFDGSESGPYYPSNGPIPFDTYKKQKKTDLERQADQISELASIISIPRSVMTNAGTANILQDTDLIVKEKPKSIPFEDKCGSDFFNNKLTAKEYIARYIGKPLSRLTETQNLEINKILDESLNKNEVITKIKTYFTLIMSPSTGDQICMGK